MSRPIISLSEAASWTGRLVRRLWGRSISRRLALLAAFLAVLGVFLDLGKLYYVRGAMRLTAAAGAIVAGEGLVAGGPKEARRRAVRFIKKIIPTNDFLAGAVPVIEFPRKDAVRVRFRNSAVPLNYLRYLGLGSVPLSVSAEAELSHVSSVQPKNLVPMGVYCHRPAGCAGVFAVGQRWTMRLFCGDYFRDGPAGNTCGPPLAEGENFLLGLIFSEEVLEYDVWMNVLRGESKTVRMGQRARAWRDEASGWELGLLDRLAEGRNEFTLPVLRKGSGGAGGFNMEVADFIQVRVDGWSMKKRSVRISFEIIRSAVATRDFAKASQGYGVNSVVGVRLVN